MVSQHPQDFSIALKGYQNLVLRPLIPYMKPLLQASESIPSNLTRPHIPPPIEDARLHPILLNFYLSLKIQLTYQCLC